MKISESLQCSAETIHQWTLTENARNLHNWFQLQYLKGGTDCNTG